MSCGATTGTSGICEQTVAGCGELWASYGKHESTGMIGMKRLNDMKRLMCAGSVTNSETQTVIV